MPNTKPQIGKNRFVVEIVTFSVLLSILVFEHVRLSCSETIFERTLHLETCELLTSTVVNLLLLSKSSIVRSAETSFVLLCQISKLSSYFVLLSKFVSDHA